MCYKNTDQIGRGRPTIGVEKRTVARNIRLEPYIDTKLTRICKTFNISKSEAIRQGILMYINEAEKTIANTNRRV